MVNPLERKTIKINFRIEGTATEDVKTDLASILEVIVGNFKHISDLKLVDETHN